MKMHKQQESPRTHRAWLAVAAVIFNPAVAFGQALTGELICTVKDANGAVVQGATVRLALPALIGGAVTRPTPAKGQLRFPVLPPGSYVMDIEMEGFAPVHEADIRIGAGQQIERYAVLQVAGVAESIVVIAATGSPARPRPRLLLHLQHADRLPIVRFGPRLRVVPHPSQACGEVDPPVLDLD